MGILKRLFGSADSKPADSGVYLYVQCDHCKQVVQLRLEPQYELVPEDGGFRSHKTVVDTRCYRRMPTVFHFDQVRRLVRAEIQGGSLVDRAAYDSQPGWRAGDERTEG